MITDSIKNTEENTASIKQMRYGHQHRMEIPNLASLSRIWFFPKCVKIRNRNSHVKLLMEINVYTL